MPHTIDSYQKYKDDLKQQIIEAIQAKDVEKLKGLKLKVERDKWLEAWRASGAGMEVWLQPNPFIKFSD